MLQGIDPIIIFQFYKNIPSVSPTIATMPLTSDQPSRVTTAIIPVYLSETITGVYIDTESKNIDINTDAASTTDGSPALMDQKLLGSITTINLVAKQGSVGLTIILALSELVLDKVTSREFEITYMHGAVTVFGGLLHSFSFDQGTQDDLYKIKIEISKGRPSSKVGAVANDPNATRLGTTGTTPDPSTPVPSSGASPPPGSSQIQPSLPVGGKL